MVRAVVVFLLFQTAWACPAPDLFKDDFSTVYSGWKPADPSLLSTKDGKLTVNVPAKSARPLLYTNDSYDRVEVCVQATPANSAESGVGIVFWATSYDSYYVFNVSDGKAWVSRQWNGDWLRPIPMRDFADIKRGVGQTNELRVALGDGQATLYVNDKKFGTLIGNQPEDGGQVGIFAQSNEASSSQFSTFGVSKLRLAQNLRVTDPIFDYDLSTVPPGWSEVSVKDHRLLLRPDAGLGQILPLPLDAYGRGDLRVKVSVEKTEGGAEPIAGLMLWVKGESYYRFDVAPISGRAGVSRHAGGRFLHPVELQESAAIKKEPGAVNELRVVFNGTQATAYINGQKFADFTGQPPDGGGEVGIFAESNGKAATTSAFQDFSFRR